MRPIDADALISEIKKDTEKAIEQDDIVGSFWLGYLAGLVIKQPPAQPELKKGEWLPDNNSAYEMRFVCSCCKESEVVPTIGFTKYKPLWDFCPNCGADMRGEKDG